jgi:hypothetical protein
MIRVTWRRLLTMLTVLVTFITCGCSLLIARSGISDRGALSNPKTRAEVNEQFGKPDDTRTCPDGRVVESRWIRQKLKTVSAPPPTSTGDAALQGLGQALAMSAVLLDIYLADIPGTVVMAYVSEKTKLHFAFVYDEAGQVLYLYDLADSQPVQFEEVTRHIRSLLTSQLENEKCASWTAILTAYVQETRQRAACIGYTLCVDEEQAFERLLTIGEGVDSGRIPREDGLAEIREVLYARPTQ